MGTAQSVLREQQQQGDLAGLRLQAGLQVRALLLASHLVDHAF